MSRRTWPNEARLTNRPRIPSSACGTQGRLRGAPFFFREAAAGHDARYRSEALRRSVQMRSAGLQHDALHPDTHQAFLRCHSRATH